MIWVTNAKDASTRLKDKTFYVSQNPSVSGSIWEGKNHTYALIVINNQKTRKGFANNVLLMKLQINKWKYLKMSSSPRANFHQTLYKQRVSNKMEKLFNKTSNRIT